MEWLSMFNKKTIYEALALIKQGPSVVEPIKILLENGVETLYTKVHDGKTYTVRIQIPEDVSNISMTCQCEESRQTGVCPHLASAFIIYLEQVNEGPSLDDMDEHDILSLIFELDERMLKSLLVYLLHFDSKNIEATFNFLDLANRPLEYHPNYTLDEYWIMIENHYSQIKENEMANETIEDLYEFVDYDFAPLTTDLIKHKEIRVAFQLSLSLIEMLQTDFYEINYDYFYEIRFKTLIEKIYLIALNIVERNKHFSHFFFDESIKFANHIQYSFTASIQFYDWLLQAFSSKKYLRKFKKHAQTLLEDTEDMDYPDKELFEFIALYLYIGVCIQLNEFSEALEKVEPYKEYTFSDMLKAKIYASMKDKENTIKYVYKVNSGLQPSHLQLYVFWMGFQNEIESILGERIKSPTEMAYDRWSEYGDPKNYTQMCQSIPDHLLNDYQTDVLQLLYSPTFLHDIYKSGDMDMLFKYMLTRCDIESIDSLFDHLKDDYSDELKLIYKDKLLKEFETSYKGREHYAKNAKFLKHLFDLKDGKTFARSVANQLITLYPKRTAMKEELDAIFDE